MRCEVRRAVAPTLALAVALAAGATAAREGARQRVVPRAEAAALLAAADPDPLGVLEKLNRADRRHLARLDVLVVPVGAPTDPMRHAPFPRRYPASTALPKLLVVDLAWQAFAAYEDGRLVRWGPVSSGRRDDPTPSGAFHLAWKSLGRRSTVNPRWYMPWYFNFASTAGLALHAYTLPGHPASHACIRLLPRDARWLYRWGEQWTLAPDGRTVLAPGTPVLVTGAFDFDAPPPWRSPERLATGATLPAALPFAAAAD
jgi:lipoprotein-anchoring transpeptidase ErfK/SrfK